MGVARLKLDACGQYYQCLPRGDLLLETGHAHHVELGEVGREDAEVLRPLEQRVARVAGLLEHAVLELEERDLPVEVQLGCGQLDPCARCHALPIPSVARFGVSPQCSHTRHVYARVCRSLGFGFRVR